MSTSSLLQKYPIRNNIWMFHEEDQSFSAEESTLRGNDMITDPWSRPLPAPTKTHRGLDNDITHWTLKTTVAGQPVELTIWND